MNKELTKGERVLIACFIFFVAIIFGAFIIAPAADEIINAGRDMFRIRSVAGNTIDESYYQAHGEIYMYMGRIIKALAIMGCLIAGFVSGRIIKPVFAKKPKSYNSYIIYCSKCNAQNETNAAFCRGCGAKLGE